MIINENCWQYCQYPQSWQLYLLKFVQVVHEIDMSFLHLHVSIISISLNLKYMLDTITGTPRNSYK